MLIQSSSKSLSSSLELDKLSVRSLVRVSSYALSSSASLLNKSSLILDGYASLIHALQGYVTATLGYQRIATFLQRSLHACSVTLNYFGMAEE